MIDSSLVDAYLGWVTLNGGWEPGADDGTQARPAWQRGWRGSEAAARALPLVEAVATHAFIRYSDRQRDPESPPDHDRRDEPGLLSDDASYLLKMGAELVSVMRGQGLLPPLDLETGSPTTLVPAIAAAPHFFSGEPSPREQAAQIHTDHRRALRILTGAFYAWRGDIAFRRVGPKRVVGGFSPHQAKALGVAKALYVAAGGLLELDRPDGWVVGLGLTGRCLGQTREALANECRLRIAQIDAGRDYANESTEWPMTYAWEILEGLGPLFDVIERLENRQLDAEFTGADIERDIEAHALAERRSVALLEAARSLQGAEEAVEAALGIERDRQALRVRQADIRRKGADWHTAGLKFSLLAHGADAAAESALTQAEDYALQLLHDQIDLLQKNVASIQEELPHLQGEIRSAEASLASFEKTAREEHRRKESQRVLFSILKAVGSLVSRYFTGVDLVSIAQSAYDAFRSAQSGDWASAASSAFDAANQLSGGKLKGYLDNKLAAAQRYVGSLMSDSLSAVAKSLAQATGVSDAKAIEGAIEAVGRQAFRVGVSFLAERTNLQNLVASLGYGATSDEITSLRDKAEKAVFDAVRGALERQGGRVLDEVGRQLTPSAEGLERRLRTALTVAGSSVEREAVALIGRVRRNVPEADVAALKAQLLEARKALVDELAARANVAAERVESAVDQLMDRALRPTALPPAALPPEIVGLVAGFRLKVSDARARVSFLTMPDLAERKAKELADFEGQTFEASLSRMTGELRDGISAAGAAMNQASVDLAQLRAALTNLKVDEAKQQFRRDAQEWRERAANHRVDSQSALWQEAGESLVAAQQQVQIEQLGLAATVKRHEAQTLVTQARRGETRAAADQAKIAALELRRVHDRRERWRLLSGDSEDDRKVLIAETRLQLLERANSRVIQAWQLLDVFETDLAGLKLDGFRPSYSVPRLADVRLNRAMLMASEEDWNVSLPEDFRVRLTFQPGDLLERLPGRVRQVLQPRMSQAGTTWAWLKLAGPDDLRRLRDGITFRLRPLRAPAGWTDAVTLTAMADGAGTYVDDRVPAWNDVGIFRMRLLGVMLLITGGVSPGRGVALYLVQEGDSVVVVRDANAVRRAVRVPLPRMRGADAQLGIQLASGEFVHRQFETRPAYADYTLRIDEDSYGQVDDPENFAAELHFAVIGTPQ